MMLKSAEWDFEVIAWTFQVGIAESQNWRRVRSS
jgi:hypothetical protein